MTSHPPKMSLSHLFDSKKLIICCGSGGVGKTTVAAALALKACLAGKNVVVLTIDPARRLANSLGLKEVSTEAHLVSEAEFEKVGLSPKGSLTALMLDAKEMFDKIVKRYAESEESKQAILNNPLYKHLSTMIAGSQEYMAMEKVYELSCDPRYDLLILDTPPTQQALDFLEAPSKMVRAVGESMLQWIVRPSLQWGATSLKWLGRGARRVFGVFGQMVGMEFLDDLSLFLISASGLLAGFKDRAEEVARLLRDEKTGFLVVTVAQEYALKEAVFFYEKIREGSLPFEAFVVNRTYAPLGEPQKSPMLQEDLLSLGLSEATEKKLEGWLSDYTALVRQSANQLKSLSEKTGEPVLTIPIFEQDVHDLAGLARVAEAL